MQGDRVFKISHVFLEPVKGPKDRLHTRRTGPYLIINSNSINYTLEKLVSNKDLRVDINRIVPYLFDPKQTDPLEVTAQITHTK